MLGVGELRLQRMALFDRHRGAKGRFDAVARAQAGDLLLDVLGQPLVGQHHVGPHRVAADRRALDAAQHATERRLLAPGRIGVPGVFVAVVRRVRRLVDADEARVLGIAAGDRVIFQLAEVARKRDVLGPRDVLVAKEQHVVLQQQLADLRDQVRVARRDTQIHVRQLGADRAGQLLDLYGALESLHDRRGASGRATFRRSRSSPLSLGIRAGGGCGRPDRCTTTVCSAAPHVTS